MEQVKIFYGHDSMEQAGRVEQEVNDWLEKRHSDIKTSAFEITRVLQSSGNGGTMISIFYKQGQARS